MLKKIVFNTIFLTFLLGGVSLSSEEGMPQLNPEFWFSQIFWLTIIFGILYFLLAKFILPKIGNNLEARKSQIVDNIQAAEKQKKESEKKIKEYEKIMQDSLQEAKNVINKAREKTLEEILKKKEALENEINKEVKKAEEEILKLKNNSQKKISKIATETSASLVKEIIGEELNSSSISTIVEDIAKKNQTKIYDN